MFYILGFGCVTGLGSWHAEFSANEHNPQFMRSLHHEFSSTIDIALSSNAVRLARRAPIELGPYDRIAFLRFRKTASSAVIKALETMGLCVDQCQPPPNSFSCFFRLGPCNSTCIKKVVYVCHHLGYDRLLENFERHISHQRNVNAGNEAELRKVEAANLYILELFRRPAHRALSLFFYQTESVGCTFWKGTFTEDELAARCAGPKLTPSIDAWVKIPNAPSFVQSYLKHTQGTSHSPEDARLRLQMASVVLISEHMRESLALLAYIFGLNRSNLSSLTPRAVNAETGSLYKSARCNRTMLTQIDKRCTIENVLYKCAVKIFQMSYEAAFGQEPAALPMSLLPLECLGKKTPVHQKESVYKHNHKVERRGKHASSPYRHSLIPWLKKLHQTLRM